MANVTLYVVTNWQNLPTKTTPVDATNLNHIETGVKNVTDFVNLLNTNNNTYYVLSEVAFTNTLKSKLDGIDEHANNYSLPTASTQVLGGVKVDGTTITIENGVITSTTSGVDTLAGLTDINLEDLADGQILKYDAETQKWVNTSEAEVRTQLSLLEDVDIDDASLADGQVLKYNGTSEKWENAEDAGGDVLGYDETLDILGLPANPIYRYRELIPAMTSNTTPSGEASASSQYSADFPPWKCMSGDGGDNKRWVASYNSSGDNYIQYEFDEPETVAKILIIFGGLGSSDSGHDCGYTLKGSNDGITFTDLTTFSSTASQYKQEVYHSFENSNSYKYYRLQFNSYNVVGGGAQLDGLHTLQLYSRYLA